MSKLIEKLTCKRTVSNISFFVLFAFCTIIFASDFLHDDPVEFFKPDNVECIACQFANSSFIASDNYIIFQIEFSRYLNIPLQAHHITIGDLASDYRERGPPNILTTI